MIVVHLIPSLSSGGAERALTRIVDGDKNEHVIVIFKEISNENVFYKITRPYKLHSLQFRSFKSLFSSIKLFSQILDKYKPDVIQTWMYHANIFGGLISFIKGYRNIYWNIRSAEISIARMKIRTLFLVFLGSFFSHIFPKKIISCSRKAIRIHSNLLYKKSKFLYIPNGVEDYLLASKISNNKTPIIGFVARYDPQKNHDRFLKAIKKVEYDLVVYLIGRDIEKIDISTIQNSKVKILKVDHTVNIIDFYDKFDFLVLPSIYGEAFPNVLIEAMSRGVICIASDVGDSLSIISGSGYEIYDPFSTNLILKSLNTALEDFYNNQDIIQTKSLESISRVKKYYLIKNVIEQYNLAWTIN